MLKKPLQLIAAKTRCQRADSVGCPMSSIDQSNARKEWAWYVYHALAVLAATMLIAGLIACALLLSNPDPQAAARAFFSSEETAEAFPRVAPVLFAVMLATLWLWVAMLRHFLANRATISRVWMFWLIASNWAAAVVYFFLVWRPSNRGARLV